MKANVKFSTKRALSLLLVLLMVFAMVPMTAFAVADNFAVTNAVPTGFTDGDSGNVHATLNINPAISKSGGNWRLTFNAQFTKTKRLAGTNASDGTYGDLTKYEILPATSESYQSFTFDGGNPQVMLKDTATSGATRFSGAEGGTLSTANDAVTVLDKTILIPDSVVAGTQVFLGIRVKPIHISSEGTTGTVDETQADGMVFSFNITLNETTPHSATFLDNVSATAMPTATIYENVDFQLPTPAPVDGYVFKGWEDTATHRTYAAGTKVPGAFITGNMQFWAIWEATSASSGTSGTTEMVTVSWANSSDYTVTPAGSSPYMRKGGDFVFTVTPAEGVTINSVTATSGTLANTSAVYVLTNVQENATIAVTATRATYTVTYNANYGETPTTATATKYHNIDLVLANGGFTRTGYSLAGWATTANGAAVYGVSDVYSGNAAITLYAVWQANAGTVTYETGADASETVTGMPGNVTGYVGLYTIPSLVPTRVGYTFTGWKVNGSDPEVVYQPGEQLEVGAGISYTLTAQWGENTYNVVVDSGIGFTSVATPAVVNYNGETTVTLTVAAGYDAANLVVSVNGTQVAPAIAPESLDTTTERVFTYTISDIDADQKITVSGVVPATYHIIYNAGGGTINTGEVLTYTYGTAVTLPTDVTRDGYAFGGWKNAVDYSALGGGVADAVATVIPAGSLGDRSFVAEWTVNTYDVSLKQNVDGVTVVASAIGAGNATLVVGETDATTVKLTNVTYGSQVDITVTTGTDYDANGMVVTANGREQGLVAINGTSYSYLIDHIDEDVVIAVTRVAQRATVTYDDGHADTVASHVPAAQSVNIGDTVTVSSYVPERAGYYFKYWIAEEEADAAVTYADPAAPVETPTVEPVIVLPGDTITVNKNTTLIAQWEKVQYTITYVLNGGAMNEPAEAVYDVETNVILPTNVTRFGYTFAGWYTISNFKTAVINPDDGVVTYVDEPATTAIPVGSTGDKVFYAKWTNTKGVTIEIETVEVEGTATPIAQTVIPTTPVDLNAVEAGTGVTITFTPAEGNALDKHCVAVYTSGANDNGAYNTLLPDYTVVENSDGTVKVSFVMPEAKVKVSVRKATEKALSITFDEAAGANGTEAKYTYNGVQTVLAAAEGGNYAAILPVGAEGYFSFNVTEGYHLSSIDAYYNDANGQAVALDYTLSENAGKYTVTFVMPKGDAQFKVNISTDYKISAQIEETTKTTTDDPAVAYKVNGATVIVTKPTSYTLDSATVKAGTGVTFTVEPVAVGTVVNEVRNVYVTYTNDGATIDVPLNLTDGVYSFNMPAADVVIHVDLKDWTKTTLDTDAADDKGYEGDVITVTATVTDVAALNEANQGTVKFYWTNTALETVTVANIEDLTAMGVAGVDQSGVASVPFELPEASANPTVYFYAVYGGSAYFLESYTQQAKTVKVLSTAIAWTETSEVANNEITIYTADTLGNKTSTTATAMSAGHTYYLAVPDVVPADDTTALTVDTDYRVVWLYADSADAASDNWKLVDWTDNTSKELKVTPEYVHYSYKAQVYPTNVEATTVLSRYNKAVAYTNEYKRVKTDAGVLSYVNYLETRATSKVQLTATATDLTIQNAIVEDAGVTINGGPKFNWGQHLTQYEGQNVTLRAEIVEAGTETGVNVGKVYFYRYVDGANDTLLNEDGLGVAVVDGVATMQYTIPTYQVDHAASDKENCSYIYAVYVEGATYDTSASVAKADGKYAKPNGALKNMVFTMSTKLMVPVVISDVVGKIGTETNKYETTYTSDLTGLLAGVPVELNLKTDVTTADYSVVALDGRKVDGDYTIQWLYKTGSNEENANGDSANATYNIDSGKVQDKFRVKLTGTGAYEGSVAYSKYVVIGEKQNVTVVVTATPDEQYQLGEVVLEAAVKGVIDGDTAESHPTGKVVFYYYDDAEDEWVEIGSTRDGVFNPDDNSTVFSITTTELPVTAVTNVLRELTITAVYEGDETFAASRNYNADDETWVEDFAAAGVTNEEVTIYSSAVHVEDTVQNKPVNVAPVKENGIVITVEGDESLADAAAANETVTLNISDVFTLDYGATAAVVANRATLQYGVDYKVEWQKVENYSSWAASEKDINSEWSWTKIGEGESCEVAITEDSAYRAVVKVEDTAPVQASWQQVDQGTVGEADIKDGMRTYYSNLLTAKNGQTTLTVNLNTSELGEDWEGIVQGETVTVHTYTSGAFGETPIAEMTVKAGKDGETETVATKANVNGYVGFDWLASEPGFYVIEVEAKPNNGYNEQYYKEYITVRDNDYSFAVTNTETVYNGRTQGVSVVVNNMAADFNAAAQKSWIVTYKDAQGNLVEPNEAGTYTYTVTLPASAYWTEESVTGTFVIKQRQVSVEDLVAQVKVYDGEEYVNIQEIVLHDAATYQGTTGLPSENIGVINGDSIYAVGEGYVDNVNAGERNLKVRNVELLGDDRLNYEFVDGGYSEKLQVQRSQVKGAIAENTYKYTGSDIVLTADDIYLIDQAGTQLSDYDVIYYYHNGEGVEQVSALNRLGKYTVIARPNQNNYKGGAVQTIYVVSGEGTINPVDKTAKSALIDITDTVTVYNPDGNTGVTVEASKGTATAQYYVGGDWTASVPANAGRYLVKATVTNGTVTDTAYGIYTVVKARPEITLALGTDEKVYDSALFDVTPTVTSSGSGEVYYSYAGEVVGGVNYQAPQNVGSYIITAHVNETENYTAYEVSESFGITPKTLTITAESYMRQRFSAFPKMTATYEGLALNGVAKDTSLRDVQIQPEFIFDSYDNIDSTTVGTTHVYLADALAVNYNVVLVDHSNDQAAGIFTATDNAPNPTLVIKGYSVDGNGTPLAYYGDSIQLYTYGDKTGAKTNPSSFITWKSSDESVAKFVDKRDNTTASETSGWLVTTGVGTTTITVTRGIGVTAITESFELKVDKQEVVVVVPESNVVYDVSNYDKTMSGITPRTTLEVVNDAGIDKTNTTRTEVGTQVTTGTVKADNTYYQSETYGGLFTVNDREVTVKPVEASTVYGTLVTGLTYTEENTVTGKPALKADGKAVSTADVYNNLDALDGYEILVAGREEKNYNVKYSTDQLAYDVEVTAKLITVTHGTYPENKGMTGGAVTPLGDYDAKGFDFDTTKTFQQNSVRMYGEPNWVMGINETALVEALVAGDSLADLNALLTWLNEYDIGDHHDIAEDANVKYDNKTEHITGRTADYYVDSALAIKNYTVTNAKGVQNIYQRPVDLVLREGLTAPLTIYRKDIYDGDTLNEEKLLKIIKANLVATTHDGEGGLAKLLNHTIEDLNLRLEVTGSGSTLTVKVKVGNLNYWSEGIDITVSVELTKVVAKYSQLGRTTSYVYMYNVDDAGIETAITEPLAGKVMYKVYLRDAEDDGTMTYSDYKDKTPLREVEMTYVSGNTYKATYSSMPDGKYVMFAIANNYTIVD